MSKIVSIKCLINKQSGLNYPSGLSYDRNLKDLYICDLQNNRVIRFNLMSGTFKPLSNDIISKQKKPLAITINKNNQIVITDAMYNCLFSYMNNKWVKINYNGNLKINLPGSIACDKKGNMFISDFLNNRICKVDLSNNISVINEIKCKKPYGICIHNNKLYITDTGNCCIKWYNLITKKQGILINMNITPIAITVDEDGDIYFSEDRKLYLYNYKTKVTEHIISKDNWSNYKFEKLCHLGALVSISRSRLIFSDTIKNCIYDMKIEKVKEKING